MLLRGFFAENSTLEEELMMKIWEEVLVLQMPLRRKGGGIDRQSETWEESEHRTDERHPGDQW